MRINKDKSIGRVLFIVEGGRTEFNLLKKVFCDILNYDYIERRRGDDDFFERFQNKERSTSKVAVINSKESHISYIGTNEDEYLDELFAILVSEYNFPVDRAAIFYLFDRDPLSNTRDLVEKLVNGLQDPYENEELRGGLLLLSYPAVESYIISSFKEDAHFLNFELGSEAKNFNNANSYMLNNLSSKTIIKATNELMKYLKVEKIDFDIDNFSKANIEIFNKQEEFYRKNSKYKVLSLLSVVFIYLGIIEVE